MSAESAALAALLVHGHCGTCGAPILWDYVASTFVDLDVCRLHVCPPAVDQFICECGEVLGRSCYGKVYEALTNRPHFCTAQVDRAERELAFERGSWRRK